MSSTSKLFTKPSWPHFLFILCIDNIFSFNAHSFCLLLHHPTYKGHFPNPVIHVMLPSCFSYMMCAFKEIKTRTVNSVKWSPSPDFLQPKLLEGKYSSQKLSSSIVFNTSPLHRTLAETATWILKHEPQLPEFRDPKLKWDGMLLCMAQKPQCRTEQGSAQ